MNHLVEELGRLGSGADQPTPEDVVRRDLLRGRAALARRRARRTVTGLGTIAATAVLALALTGGESSPSRHPAPTGLDLVAYTGAQLPGFTVAKVPEGFVLQGANAYSLDIAPRENTTSLDDYRGKLVVMLQSKDATGVPAGKQVEVNGHPGTISTVDPTAKQLYYSDGTHQIVVQSPPEIGLTDAELVEFAAGVTVTAQATAGVG
ncbi:MAG TPA: hypothetical protein VHO29_04660 [Marmoricola sp.]|nr:hypothetical protein [Marmoricola sp.]